MASEMSPKDAATLNPLPMTTDSCEENKTDDEYRSLLGNLKDQLPTEDLKKGFKLTLLAMTDKFSTSLESFARGLNASDDPTELPW